MKILRGIVWFGCVLLLLWLQITWLLEWHNPYPAPGCIHGTAFREHEREKALYAWGNDPTPAKKATLDQEERLAENHEWLVSIASFVVFVVFDGFAIFYLVVRRSRLDKSLQPTDTAPGVLNDPSSSERYVLRPAVLPILSIAFVVCLLTGIATILTDLPFYAADVYIILIVSIAGSSIATVYFWWITAEVLSPDGVEIWTFLGRRLLAWQYLVAIRPLPAMRVLYLRFDSGGAGVRRVLIFQRQAGEFRRIAAGFVPKGNPAWRQVNDTEPNGPAGCTGSKVVS
jgi:hypothetical protein